jgi:hypothetical protein
MQTRLGLSGLSSYAPKNPDLVPVSSWLETLEERYFEQRQRNKYFVVLRQLPQGGALG